MDKISKEDLKRVLFNEMHKTLMIVDIGSEKYPDYVIRGQEELINNILQILYEG